VTEPATTHRLLALVLRASTQREADVLLTVLSRERGKLTLLARGARKSKRRFAGLLAGMCTAEFTVEHSQRTVPTALSADLVSQWHDIGKDLTVFAHANYILEMLVELVPELTPEPELFDLVVAVLDSLAVAGPSRALLRLCEDAILQSSGQAPMLDACLQCGGYPGPAARFVVARGGALCAGCGDGQGGALPAEAQRLATLLRACDSIGEARALDVANVDESGWLALRDAQVGMVMAHAAHSLKSLEFLAKVSRSARHASSKRR
jgi:DNA repair protein RecO (recombination protein O)